MNAKYASKPNLNPNKANLFGFANVILAFARIQTSSYQQKNKKSKSCLSCLKYLCAICEICGSVCFQKRSQFFHDQIYVINIKNAEMEAKKLGKKTKQTQLWKTLPERCPLFRPAEGIGCWQSLVFYPAGYADPRRFL